MMSKDYYWFTWNIIYSILQSVGGGNIFVIDPKFFENIFSIGKICSRKNNGRKKEKVGELHGSKGVIGWLKLIRKLTSSEIKPNL